MEKYAVIKQSARISDQVPIFEYFDQDGSKLNYFFSIYIK